MELFSFHIDHQINDDKIYQQIHLLKGLATHY